MYNKKNLFITVLFGALCTAIFAFSILSGDKKLKRVTGKVVSPPEVTSFKDVKYYRTADGEPTIKLISENLSVTGGELLEFSKPFGSLFKEEKELNYTALAGKMDQLSKRLELKGEVTLVEGKRSYQSDNLTYDQGQGVIEANGNVAAILVADKTADKIEVKADSLFSEIGQKSVKLNGAVQGKIKRSRRYEKGLDFSAEAVEFNSLESRLTMSKYVKIRRNRYYITAGRAQVFLENFNKKLKYYELYDDVKLEEKFKLKSGKRQVRRAYAEKLVAHRRSGKMVLSGSPRVEQGRDTIKGYQITLRENAQLVEVEDAKTSFSFDKEK